MGGMIKVCDHMNSVSNGAQAICIGQSYIIHIDHSVHKVRILYLVYFENHIQITYKQIIDNIPIISGNCDIEKAFLSF